MTIRQNNPSDQPTQQSHLHAYLDDMYSAVLTDHLKATPTLVEQYVHKAHPALNTDKTNMSTTGAPHPAYKDNTQRHS